MFQDSACPQEGRGWNGQQRHFAVCSTLSFCKCLQKVDLQVELPDRI